MTMSRAQFLKLAGTTAGAAALAAAPALAEVATEETTWDREADVVICGCGTGGVAAAVGAADEGAEVLVIEKRDWKGGQLRRCGGGIAAAGTSVQKALGVEDDAESFADYWIACAEGVADEDLVRKYCENSAGVIDWVIDDLGGQPVEEWAMCGEDNGLAYDAGPGLNVGTSSGYDQYGFEPVQRCHWFTKNADDPIIEEGITYPTAGGTGLWKVFDAALEERGVEIVTETALTRLITSPEGEVVGVVALQGDAEIRVKARKGVVVATGNFADDPEMFTNYTGWEWVPSDNFGGLGLDIPDDNDGSGVRALMAIGAELRNPCYVGTFGSYAQGASYLCAGVRFDTEARVIDVFGNVIPRVYCAGLTGGGMYKTTYPLCGCSVGRSLFYGRVAGANAAKLEAWE